VVVSELVTTGVPASRGAILDGVRRPLNDLGAAAPVDRLARPQGIIA
jgi:hypothetical protein